MIVITAHQKSEESEYGIELINVYKDMYTLKLTCTDKPSYEVIMSYDEIQEIDKQNLKWIYEYAKNTADMKMLYTYSFHYDPYEAEPREIPFIDSVEATSELNSSSYIENFTIEYARHGYVCISYPLTWVPINHPSPVEYIKEMHHKGLKNVRERINDIMSLNTAQHVEQVFDIWNRGYSR